MADTPLRPRTAALTEWRARLAAAAEMSVRPVTLAGCRNWSLSEGKLVHETGRFFQVVGLEWTENGAVCSAPFLEQREIGLLATILRAPGAQSALLIQVKSEPGNVGCAQFAPTCQATASNTAAVHGGVLPPYSAYFAANKPRNLADSLQSEQGSKFLGKRNRNLVVQDDDAAIEDDAHDWVLFRDFQPLLGKDFLVNTDLRSVLVACDWRDLVGEGVFAGQDDMQRSLRRSFDAPLDDNTLSSVLDRLDAMRAGASQPVQRPIETLADWQFVPESSRVLQNKLGSISLISVNMKGREVDRWHQPIYSTAQELVFDLDCAMINGLLHFGFLPQWEPGLPGGPELAPSRCHAAHSTQRKETVLMQVRQSDEGGRFLHSIATYRITVGSPKVKDKLLWLTLAQVRDLVRHGVFNNEARSALSLLLARL